MSYVFNYKRVHSILGGLVAPSKNEAAKISNDLSLERSQKLKEKYATFDSEKLERIQNDSRYEEVARETAKYILEERIKKDRNA